MARLGEIPATAVTSSVRVDELSSEFKWTVYSRPTVFTIDRRTAVLNTKLRTEILSAGELEVNVHAVCRGNRMSFADITILLEGSV